MVVVALGVQISAVVGVVDQGLEPGMFMGSLFGPGLTLSPGTRHIDPPFVFAATTGRQAFNFGFHWKTGSKSYLKSLKKYIHAFLLNETYISIHIIIFK